MKVDEIEIMKKEKIYTMTQTELNNMLCDAKEFGSRKIKEYIMFCFENYNWKLNATGQSMFLEDLTEFLNDELTGIPNVYGLNFFEWLKS